MLSSSPPDGDSIGSAISLYLSLKKLDKEVTAICRDLVPDVLHFLPNIKIMGNELSSNSEFIIQVDTALLKDISTAKEDEKTSIILHPKDKPISEQDITFNKGAVDYDLIITVDTAELSQLGEVYENNVELFHKLPVINIDHHISNTHFGKINYVDIMASSTTELLVPILEDLAEDHKTHLIDEDIATLLLTGIITDTGSFQNANTTPKSFDVAAKLVSYGARQQEIIQHIYKTKQLSQLKLWGRVLTKIQTDDKNRIVWSTVSQQDFKDTESNEDQTGDIIDELLTNAPGAEIILLIKEKQPDLISVSIRTTTPAVDASKIAENFGGGGHTQAAGFRIENSTLRDAEYKIIEYIRNFQKKRWQGDQTQDKKLIDVEKLQKQAKQAQKATDTMDKISSDFHFSVPDTEDEKKDLSYKFEE